MKSIRKKLTSLLFFGLLITGLSGFYWLFYTTNGLVWLLDYTNKTLDNKLEYRNVQGALLKTVKFDHILFKTPALELQASAPSMKLNLRKILSRSIEITNLSADNLNILQKSAANKKPGGPDKLIIPVSISIQSLNLNKLSFTRDQQAPVVLTGIHLQDSEIADRIFIGVLNATSNYGSIALQGEVEPSLEGEIALATDFSLFTGKQELTYKGHADVSGTINHMLVSAKLLSPYNVALNGKIEIENGRPTWNLEAEAAKLSLASSTPSIPIVLEKTKIKSQGAMDNFTLKGISTVLNEQYGKWSAEFSLAKTAAEWHIITAKLNSQDEESVNTIGTNISSANTNRAVEVSGTVFADYNISEFTNLALESTWSNIQWPTNKSHLLKSNSGALSVKGSFNEYEFLSTGDFAWNKLAFKNIKLSGQGSAYKLKFSQIAADIYDGQIRQGSGSIELGENILLDAKGRLSAINLSELYPEMPSNLSGQLLVHGEYLKNKTNTTISLKQVKGTLKEQPIKGQAIISFINGATYVDGLSIRSGNSHLTTDFSLIPNGPAQPYTIKAKWDLAFPDIGIFDKVSTGSIKSHGKAQGRLDKLVLDTQTEAHNIQIDTYSIGDLTLEANIDLTDKEPSLLTLDAHKLSVKDFSVNSIQLNLAGNASSHNIKAQFIQSEQTKLILAGIGTVKDSTWDIVLKQTFLQSKQFGNWRQNKTSQLKLSADRLLLEDLCLINNEQGRICTLINSQDYRYWGGTLDFSQLPFSTLHKFLPPQFSSTKVNLNGLITFFYAPTSGVLLDFRASGENGTVSGIEIEKSKKQITFKRFEFLLSNMNYKLDTNASIEFKDGGNINASLVFPNWKQLSLPGVKENIKGNVIINLNNLAVLAVISDYIKDPVGSWRSGFSISGTVEAPLILGKSQVSAESLSLPTLGLKLQKMDLIADSNANRTIMIAGSAQSGEGKININGYFDDYRALRTSGLLKIKGESFQLVRIPEASIVASPDLTLTLKQDAIDIQGDIVITNADFKVFAPTKTIAPSPDVVIVSREDSSPLQPDIKIASKIRIVLGKNVNIQGYGFSGRLEGSVLVDDTNALTTASGDIQILNGKYVAYGKELEITHGELSFANSEIDNPLINVLATRRPGENVVVGVKIEGQVKSPSINLYSEPAMEDSDILSYIVLGHPLSEASNKDGELLTKAAASLGLIGGEKLAKKLAEKFGIDEVKLQTDHTTQDTSLLLGKYLSPDFYVGYAIGIGSAVNTLQMQYKLTDQWVLKTQSGEQQKAEILFTIEKD